LNTRIAADAIKPLKRVVKRKTAKKTRKKVKRKIPKKSAKKFKRKMRKKIRKIVSKKKVVDLEQEKRKAEKEEERRKRAEKRAIRSAEIAAEREAIEKRKEERAARSAEIAAAREAIERRKAERLAKNKEEEEKAARIKKKLLTPEQFHQEASARLTRLGHDFDRKQRILSVLEDISKGVQLNKAIDNLKVSPRQASWVLFNITTELRELLAKAQLMTTDVTSSPIYGHSSSPIVLRNDHSNLSRHSLFSVGIPIERQRLSGRGLISFFF